MNKIKLHMAAALATISAATGLNALTATASAQQNCVIGEVKWFAGNFTPRNFARANGSLLPVSRYTALFSILGTNYGGDGRTTFGLPDLQGRAMVSSGRGPGLPSVVLGQRYGIETTTLTQATLGSHNHSATTSSTLRASNGGGNQAAPTNGVLANSGSDRIYTSNAPNVTLAADSAVSTTTLTATGSGSPQAFNNVQPSLALYPLICLEGVYPSRS